jgi:GTP cyclohydrolase I
MMSSSPSGLCSHKGDASLHDRRGVHKADTDLVTSRMLGCFRTNALTRQEFLTTVG